MDLQTATDLMWHWKDDPALWTALVTDRTGERYQSWLARTMRESLLLPAAG